MIIGVAGFARSGKDSVADVLVIDYGFVKVRFADAIREAVAALDPYVCAPTGNSCVRLSQAMHACCPNDDVHEQFEAMKASPYAEEVRRLLQVFGTEVGRNQFGEDFWADRGIAKAQQYDNAVICDVRFHNEVKAIEAAGGFVIRVTRPGVDALNTHDSERFVPELKVTYEVDNDSTLENLDRDIHEVMSDAADIGYH